MPELPEVEAVRQRIHAAAAGRTIVAARILRPRIAPRGQASRIERFLTGRRIDSVTRRAKNLLIHVGGRALRVHLRMTGNIQPTDDVRFAPLEARMVLAFDAHRGLALIDPRGLGRIELLDSAAIASLDGSLGPEPLADDFTPHCFTAAAGRSRLAAKTYLMDQSRIAGIGNIYAAEILFAAGIHPARPMNRLSAARLESLHEAIRRTLEDAVHHAAATYADPGLWNEGAGFALRVYGREGMPCTRCASQVRRIVQAGRSTYYCPGCQR